MVNFDPLRSITPINSESTGRASKPLPSLPTPLSFLKKTAVILKNENEESSLLDSPKISMSYQLGQEGKYGTETLFTLPSYTQHQSIQEKQLGYLRVKLKTVVNRIGKDNLGEHLKNSTPEGQEIRRIMQGISHCRKMQLNGELHAQSDSQRPEWMATSYVRDQMKKEGVESVENTPSFPVNFRRQVYQNLDHSEVIDFMRTGVFYDPRDSGNTIPELQLFKKDPNALNTAIKKREKELQVYAKQGNLKAESAIKRSLLPLYMLKEKMVGEVDKLITKKQLFLNDQMLHLIEAQVKGNPQVVQGNKFTIVHEGLLNENLRRVDPSGLLLDEGQFMEEMADTFKRFAGKKLIFDGTGPYIDLNGNVHLAEKQLTETGAPKTVQLKTVFANFTVQGSTKNNPRQAKLNREAIARVQLLIPKSAPELTKRLIAIESELKKGKSNFDLASEFFSLMLDLRKIVPHVAISEGCFSAKDRTAVVAETGITMSGLRPTVEKAHPNAPKKTRSILAKLSERLFDVKSGISGLVSEQNTGSRLLKVSAFFWPGIGKTINAIAKRVLYLGKQTEVFLKTEVFPHFKL